MHIIISGGGKVGEFLASTLLKNGHYVVVIENDPETAQRLSIILEGDYMVISGDGCNTKYQEDAGIRFADVFVAATGKDDDNLVSCEIAKRIYKVDRCIARVNSPKNMRIFQEVGIEVASATVLIAGLIEEEALGGSMDATIALTQGSVIMSKIRVSRLKNHSDDDGVTVGEIKMPRDSIIVAVSCEDDMEVANNNTRIFPGDDVIIASNSDIVDRVAEVIRKL